MPLTSEREPILVVDDAREIRLLMTDILEAEGYYVITAEDGADGLRLLYERKPSLVITDIAMPDMDGWRFLERIREMSEVPVIMLSGLGDEYDKVRGLRTGADDYIVKPIKQGELLARVDAVLRRAGRSSSNGFEDVYEDGNLFIDFAKHDVRLRGQPLELSPQEFRLLTAFVKNPRTVLSPEQLLDLCWGMSEGAPENVRVYMGYLRKKLEHDPRSPQLLETVRGFGYRYTPQPTKG